MKRSLFLAMLFLLAAAACDGAGSDKDKGGGGGDGKTVVIKTSMGTIKAELFPDKAPVTVKNFLQYVDDKHYDGTVWHRVIKGFMIQGGGFRKGLGKATSPVEVRKMEKPTRDGIRNEADNGLKNKRGTLAM